MPHVDLRGQVIRLLTARERANVTDEEAALAELREAVGYTEKPGVLRCAWCKRILEPRYVQDPRGSDGICKTCLPAFLKQCGLAE